MKFSLKFWWSIDQSRTMFTSDADRPCFELMSKLEVTCERWNIQNQDLLRASEHRWKRDAKLISEEMQRKGWFSDSSPYARSFSRFLSEILFNCWWQVRSQYGTRDFDAKVSQDLTLRSLIPYWLRDANITSTASLRNIIWYSIWKHTLYWKTFC